MCRLIYIAVLLLATMNCGGGDKNPVDSNPPIPTEPLAPLTPPAPVTPADPSACMVGQMLSPGERCKVGSGWFSVTDDGAGLFTDAGVSISVGQGITLGSFKARHVGGGQWIVDAV